MANIKALADKVKTNAKETLRKAGLIEEEVTIDDFRYAMKLRFKHRAASLRSYQGNTKCKRRNKIEAKKRGGR